jgi:predicted permease
LENYIAALSKVLPVILLFLLGAGLNRTQFLKPATIQEIKKLVVNLTLPAVLFLAFARAEIQVDYLLIIVAIFTLCILALFLGIWIRPLTGIQSLQFPALLTGFEAGMMGYAIFSAVYGAENIYKFAVVDLGQVTFVFFILVPFLERLTSGPKPFTNILVNFLRTPVILAILGGLLANPLGLVGGLESNSITNSLVVTLGIIGGLTTPLVAIVIGYETRLQRGSLGKPLLTIGLRLLYWVPLGLAISTFLIGGFLGLDPVFQAAVLTMLLLPPPFVIPLFMKDASERDLTFVVNTLSIATLITLFAFALVGAIYPP